jgi:hypothetical protein
MVGFFDSHDMGDYEEDPSETHFEVDLQRKTDLVPIDYEPHNRLTETAERE